jgi:serine/threonine-protein kinase RsbW
MRLKVRADLGQLRRIREFVTDSASALGAESTSFDDLRLAVDEAVTNIITHGYGGGGDIELELSSEGSDLIVRLRDNAPSFDPNLAPEADLRLPGDREKSGGLGVYLMQSVMDEIIHRSIETGNELVMTKRNVIGSARLSAAEKDG